MKAIILAAGYATRLFPLTQDFPKHLIPINGKTILDYLIEKMLPLGLEEAVLVTNDKYYAHFLERKKSTDYTLPIRIINDHTKSNDDRLGAIGDMQYAIDQAQIDDDLFVVCADNLFAFDLEESLATFRKTQKSTIVAYDVQELEKAKGLGIVHVDDEDKITEFVEKPANPSSTLASSGIYYYPKSIVPQIKQYLEEGNNPDSPGNFPARLLQRDTLYAHIYSEAWYDVGTFENLASAKEYFGEENVDVEALKKGVL